MAYALSIYHKTNKKSRKDAANWGLNNPDKDCKIWLNDLDFRKNENDT